MIVGAAQDQRVQAILRRQRVARIGLAQGHAADAPVRIRAGAQRGIVHRRQMGARKRAQAQMHDARLEPGTVVAGTRHLRGQRRKAGRPQAAGLPRYQFHSVPSCCRRFTGR
ncbi:hypothetical protein D3C72_2027580 [compost metagenome]